MAQAQQVAMQNKELRASRIQSDQTRVSSCTKQGAKLWWFQFDKFDSTMS